MTSGRRKIGLWEYNRIGVFINLNSDSDKDFVEALDKYTLRTGARASTAIKTLARQQLIREGFLNPHDMQGKRRKRSL